MVSAQLTPIKLALISSPPPPQISGPPCLTFAVLSPFSSLSSTPSQQNPSVSLPSLSMLKEFFPSSSGDAVDRPGSQSSKDEFPGVRSPSGPSQPSSVASKGGMRPDAHGCRQYQPEVDSENASSPIACERNPILNCCGQSIGQIDNVVSTLDYLSSEHCASLREGAL
ncbi:hypothetical protein Nepgr_024492 [Nepenthes gracilis]|uniref:Uncharacterized protein n=1 Tax=Nepenthes gracilis TaxID=150966 RepID=A0AAD3Y030_NEPGR|nr:hypothetical protein Nepgr_024492 [Nepenthes gracilis]